MVSEGCDQSVLLYLFANGTHKVDFLCPLSCNNLYLTFTLTELILANILNKNVVKMSEYYNFYLNQLDIKVIIYRKCC